MEIFNFLFPEFRYPSAHSVAALTQQAAFPRTDLNPNPMHYRHVAVTCSLAFLGLAIFARGEDQSEPLPVLEPQLGEEHLLEGPRAEIGRIPSRPRTFAKQEAASIPRDFAPWWIKGQSSAIGSTDHAQGITLDDLYVRALRNSKQIRVFADLPLIRETGIQEAGGAFDTQSFVKAMFEHRNEPVGNSLTTGGADRFKQDQWTLEGGLKKRLITGTEVSLTQQIGRTDNNSIYFVPNPQSTAALSLSVTQPLLRGAGVGYNRSIIQIAKLDSEVAMSEFVRQTESHLLEIARTYWALYAARITYLQKQRLVTETARVTDELHARQSVDAQKTQLFRAESALASRRSDLIRAEAAVRNAQDRLKALTSDPALLEGANVELIPRDRLVLSAAPVDTQAAAQSALQHRPEVNQAFLQLRAATVREKMSKNELLPELNLVLTGALGGLDDNHLTTAYTRQYHDGGPGYGAGLVFSIPIENNIARARYERRQIETRQQVSQLKTTIDTILLEVKVSAREVATAYREAQAKYEAVTAFTEDIRSLTERRSLQTATTRPGANEAQATSDFLDDLLDAQDRRAQAEEEFIRAASNYQVAIVNLERSKGKLLAYEDVNVIRSRDEKNLPILYLEKGQRGGK